MDDAVDRLLEAFRRIDQERMAGVAFYNDRLQVEAVEFGAWEGRLAGVLITPWLMNLVVMPTEREDWQDMTPGSKVELSLPSGRYEFTTCLLPEVGFHLSLPLFTGVADFPDHETARAVAADTRRRLFAEAAPPAVTAKMTKRGMKRRAFLGMAAGPKPGRRPG